MLGCGPRLAGGADPLKGIKGFVRAPKKGGHHDEQLTEMEVRPGAYCYGV
jgi:hypothetical protein